MASFSIRTFNVTRNGRRYKVHIRTEQKEIEDWFDYLAERYETSNLDQESFGPFTMTVRRAQ